MNCSVLVMSCDGYSDLWEPFFKLFNKYWDCPYTVYLGTENKNYTNALKSTGLWTKRLRENLEKIDTKYVIFMLDDFFLRKQVDNKRIEAIIEQFKDDIAVFNLEMGYDKTDSFCLLEGFKTRSKRANYLCSCQPSIWDREKLLGYLQKDMTPWQWETQMLQTEWKHYINYGELIFDIGYYLHRKPWGIVQGKWARECVDLFKKENIEVDYEKRGFYN